MDFVGRSAKIKERRHKARQGTKSRTRDYLRLREVLLKQASCLVKCSTQLMFSSLSALIGWNWVNLNLSLDD